MEPLGRFWETFCSFSQTLGRLLENVSKTIQKVTRVHPKSPKGAPKAPKRLPKSEQKESVFGEFVRSADFKKESKTGVQNYDHKCPSSIAPAILLEVRVNSVKNPNVTKVWRLPYF